MSGIAGILSLDGRPIDPTLIERMTAAMCHRGPDGVGHWVDGSVALGHRMLHATPESLAESQPLLDEQGRLCLTFDGRVDNRKELRDALEAAGIQLRDSTDAELVLKAYQCWGEECPARVLGDFAFAVWDRRNRKLFCARDPLGVKPFYYHTDGGRFLFASEMQALFEDPTLERQPNLPLIGLYLLRRFDERVETLYEGILRLPAAHSLTLGAGNVRKKQYWDFDPQRTIRFRTDAEYAEQFLTLFREAVGARLRSHRPVGTWLSGGLDSSSITCTGAMLRQPGIVPDNGLETFSILYDDARCDERTYSSAVVQEWNLTGNFITHEQQDPSLFDLSGAGEFPDVFYNPVLCGYIPSLRDMRDRGFAVLLEGSGGDELLETDFSYLTDLLLGAHFLRLGRKLRSDVAYYRFSHRMLLLNHCVRPLIPKPVRTVLRPLSRRLWGSDSKPLVRDEFIVASGLVERLNSDPPVRKFPTRSQQAIYSRLFHEWNATVGRDMVELFVAAFGIEKRHPYLDRRLAEFLLAVPEEQRWGDIGPKAILRRAMKGILPETVRGRTGKPNFSPPIDHEFKKRQAGEIERLFRTSTLVSLGVVDQDQLLQTFEEYRAGSPKYLTTTVKLALELELWCRAATSMEKPVHCTHC